MKKIQARTVYARQRIFTRELRRVVSEIEIAADLGKSKVYLEYVEEVGSYLTGAIPKVVPGCKAREVKDEKNGLPRLLVVWSVPTTDYFIDAIECSFDERD